MKKNNTTEKSILNAKKLTKALKEGTEKTLQSIINETINNLILEDEEKDVEEPIVDDEEETVADDSFEVEDVDSDDESNVADEDAVEGESEEASDEDEKDEWSDFEEFKTDEDDYDFTEKGEEVGEKLIKIFDMIEDGDKVIVTKDGNELEISNETTGENEVVELDSNETVEDDSMENENNDESEDEKEEDEFEFEFDVDKDEDDEDVESEFEIEIDDEPIEESTNLGYTDNYQKKSAMTTPPNKEVANPKDTYSMDEVPEGDGKRWAGKGDMKPFEETVCEEIDAELEEGANVGGAVQQRSASKSKIPAGRKAYVPKGTKHASFGSEYQEIVENLEKIKAENKALKEGAKALKASIKEAAVLNVNLGRIINLLVNETTTRNEKKSILNRFNNVKTIAEGASLYETIKSELNESKKTTINIDNALVVETKKSLNETTIYTDRNSNPSLDLMDRMDRLYKK